MKYNDITTFCSIHNSGGKYYSYIFSSEYIGKYYTKRKYYLAVSNEDGSFNIRLSHIDDRYEV